MAIFEFLGIAGLGVLVGFLINNLSTNRSQKRELDVAFYRLLASQNGRVSLIQLAAVAQVSAEVAQDYLDRQVQMFAAFPEVDDEGNTTYRFPRLNLPRTTERGGGGW
ncbi:MAG: hypothetical protein HC835_20865 [Oscillatoriales cyanobacterium RM2_1_1]|nr:hypothetical protein [Oscillatoriales cyanobacterium RM2_1_1]